jgi:hypothetical protein
MQNRKTFPGYQPANVAGRVPAPGRPLSFSPGVLETRVLARIDGVLTVGEPAHDRERATPETMASLERLERLGAVRWMEHDAPNDSERVTSPDPSFDRVTLPNNHS